MQKRKSNKGRNVSKFDASELSNICFDAMMEDVEIRDSEVDQIGQMASAAMTTAIELSKLVIENRLRNSDHMVDEDIYKIYGKSFKSIVRSASGIDD